MLHSLQSTQPSAHLRSPLAELNIGRDDRASGSTTENRSGDWAWTHYRRARSLPGAAVPDRRHRFYFVRRSLAETYCGDACETAFGT